VHSKLHERTNYGRNYRSLPAALSRRLTGRLWPLSPDGRKRPKTICSYLKCGRCKMGEAPFSEGSQARSPERHGKLALQISGSRSILESPLASNHGYTLRLGCIGKVLNRGNMNGLAPFTKKKNLHLHAALNILRQPLPHTI